VNETNEFENSPEEDPSRFLIGSYKEAIRDLRTVCQDKPPTRYQARLRRAEQIVSAQTAGRRLEVETEFAVAAFGPLWARERTQWSVISDLLAWAESGRCASAEYRFAGCR
jgi:hypothetical protein